MWNNLEEKVLGILKDGYGPLWEKKDEELINQKRTAAKLLYTNTSEEFSNNPSAMNYNMLITAMLSLQYWTQKKANTFTVEADF